MASPNPAHVGTAFDPSGSAKHEWAQAAENVATAAGGSYTSGQVILLPYKRNVQLRSTVKRSASDIDWSRNSYQEGTLAQTRAETEHAGTEACKSCRKTPLPAGPFQTCTTLNGYFNGSCSNCVYSGYPNRCSFSSKYESKDPKDDSASSSKKAGKRKLVIDVDDDSPPPKVKAGRIGANRNRRADYPHMAKQKKELSELCLSELFDDAAAANQHLAAVNEAIADRFRDEEDDS
ncbi:MAG: hypothetical protein M1830_009526 [Pleopsidium flavum]|nr:MAG: hypothetical protein M1830_009526 [Pleopsidium flavum]